jgi:uncharacterized protein
MSNEELITKTAEFVKQKFAEDSTGHDWWHLQRVWKLAKHIAAKEKNADMLVVELTALLHDIADFKFHDGDTEAGPKAAREWLESLGANEKTIAHVEDIIRNVSFKGAKVKNNLNSIEGKIVYDADKLDAMGAIGIGRVFAYTGATGGQMYVPGEKVVHHMSKDAYLSKQSSAVIHFYEKLLLLKDRMYTKTGKQMAIRRHEFMERYLDEFYAEWEGKQ